MRKVEHLNERVRDMLEKQGRNTLSDDEIKQLLVEDRKENFVYLVTKYTGYLIVIAKKWGNNDDDAKDIVQKVLRDAQKAFQNEITWKPERILNLHLKQWLATNTWRECYHEHVRRKQRPEGPLPTDTNIETGNISRLFAKSDEIPEEAIAKKELMKAILKAFERLTPTFNEVMHLSILEGWSHKDIAIMLRLKYSTVRTRYTRGLKLLQALVLEELLACGEEQLSISLKEQMENDEKTEEE